MVTLYQVSFKVSVIKKIFLSGHRDFGNRGCEAIIRSTVGMIREFIPDAEFVVPSTNVSRDRSLWPEAETYGVVFRECLNYSLAMKVFSKFRKRLGWLNNQYPPVAPPLMARRYIKECDAVLSVGGDNYSEDYSLPFLPLLLDRYAMDQGKLVILWGASVGPFERSKSYEKFMAYHMRRYSRVYVRESYSEIYCREVLAVSCVEQFADPAFFLDSESADKFYLEERQYVGVNISPLVLGKLGEKAENFLNELAYALNIIHQRHKLDVLLIPHVMAYSGPNDDRRALCRLKEKLDACAVPNITTGEEFNAPQLKGLIAGCRLFMGARTHSTIAAMSVGVPVISIGYSVKATGINQKVFGDARYVIDYRNINASSLIKLIDDVLRTGGAALDERARETMRKDAHRAGQSFCKLISNRFASAVVRNSTRESEL